MKDDIHYLAIELLDIASRTHFTATGIDEVEAKLRAFLAKAASDAVSGAFSTILFEPLPEHINTFTPGEGLFTDPKTDGEKHIEIVKKVVRSRKPKA